MKRRQICALALTLLLVACYAPLASQATAQTAGAAAGRQRARQRAAQRAERAAQAAEEPVVRRIAPEFLSGDVVVTVGATRQPTLNLGLAQNGIIMIEFPATDTIYMVHPGSEAFVTVDRTRRSAHDPLILRPGTNFVVPTQGAAPATLVTVQMGSGVVFPFMIYPVRSVRQNAHRVVLTYDRAEVVAMRLRAGLPVNYTPATPAGNSEVSTPASNSSAPRAERSPAATSVAAAADVPQRASATMPAAGSTPAVSPQALAQTPISASLPVLASPSAPPPSMAAPALAGASASPRTTVTPGSSLPTPTERPRTDEEPAPESAPTAEIIHLLRERMRVAVAEGRSFGRPSRPTHGLTVALTRPQDFLPGSEYVVVAVRNAASAPLRIVPGQPEITIETFDDRNRPVLIEQVRRIGTETTAPEGLRIAPGATIYFAVAYDTPILGARQRLRLMLAQTNAADEPIAVDLAIPTR